MPTKACSGRNRGTEKTVNSVGGKKTQIYRSGQVFTKKFGKSGLQVPVPQQLRIVEKYMQGMSIRRIAEDEDRARQTVTKIVRAPEVQNYIEKLREQVIALGDEMLNSVRYALRNELHGQLGYQMLKDIGVIQAAQVRCNDQSYTPEERHQKLTEEWTRRLNLIALEKSAVYGTTLPPGLQFLRTPTLGSQAISK